MSKTGQRAGIALLLTVVGFALLWPEAEGGRLNPFEGGEYERIAFNMIHHGQYHDARQLGNGRARPPYVRRAGMASVLTLADRRPFGEFLEPVLDEDQAVEGSIVARLRGDINVRRHAPVPPPVGVPETPGARISCTATPLGISVGSRTAPAARWE